MTQKMQVDDEIRVRIMDALLKENAVSPNIRVLQKNTGYNKNTIKASLEFLKREGVIKNYYPLIMPQKLGFNLVPMAIMQVDVSQKKLVDKVENQIKQDPYVYSARKIISSGNWNVLLMHLCRDIESYHKTIEDTYYKNVPKMDKCIRDKMIFYPTGHAWKNKAMSETIVDILKKEKKIK